jgi:hypothetical protein
MIELDAWHEVLVELSDIKLGLAITLIVIE